MLTFLILPLQLVGFIASPNAQIRALAIENLVPYSTADPAIFKCDLLAPIRNLKLLVRDHPVRKLLPPRTMRKTHALTSHAPIRRKSLNMPSPALSTSRPTKPSLSYSPPTRSSWTRCSLAS